jgi:hypothetical protein
MQSDSTTNCEEQIKSRHKTTLQFHAAAKQNDEEEFNSYRKTTLHALDAAAKQRTQNNLACIGCSSKAKNAKQPCMHWMQQQSKERKTTLHALDAAAKQKINKIK